MTSRLKAIKPENIALAGSGKANSGGRAAPAQPSFGARPYNREEVGWFHSKEENVLVLNSTPLHDVYLFWHLFSLNLLEVFRPYRL